VRALSCSCVEKVVSGLNVAKEAQIFGSCRLPKIAVGTKQSAQQQSNMVQEITSAAEFEQLTRQKGKLVVVDFSADWCKYCELLPLNI
jgi:thiol:disulfide interchange protein